MKRHMCVFRCIKAAHRHDILITVVASCDESGGRPVRRFQTNARQGRLNPFSAPKSKNFRGLER